MIFTLLLLFSLLLLLARPLLLLGPLSLLLLPLPHLHLLVFRSLFLFLKKKPLSKKLLNPLSIGRQLRRLPPATLHPTP